MTALQRALDARRPAPGLIHHTDRGSQYASQDYRDLVEEAGLVSSMSRRGDCWDNAMAESFYKTLKVELGDCFPGRAAAHRELFEYIEGFYNTRRLHSSLGYFSPTEFERLYDLQEAARRTRTGLVGRWVPLPSARPGPSTSPARGRPDCLTL